MRSRYLAAGLMTLAILLGNCSKPDFSSPVTPDPVGTPTPTPLPTPAPMISFPLSTRSGKFVDLNNKPVWLTGLVVCCTESERYDWSLISDEGLRLTANNGGNFAHIRTGPDPFGGPKFEAYRRTGSGKYDLTQPSEAYFAWLEQIASTSESLGIALETDLIDAWYFRQPNNSSPWLRENNVNGINAGDCSIFRSAPAPIHRAWVREVVKAVGSHRNVQFQDGNEVSICRGPASLAWVEGLAKEVRRSEGEFGYVRHLFGSNASESEIRHSPTVDYITIHQDYHAAGSTNGRPTLVNEYVELTPEEWEREARLAKKANTGWVYWRGDNSQAELADTLRRMKLITSGN